MADLATIIEGPNASLNATAGSSIAIWNRVEIQTDGTYNLAGSTASGEFISVMPTAAAGGVFLARFRNATGSQIYANDAHPIAVGDSIFASTSGLVTNSVTTGVYLGKARTAAAVSSYVEVVSENLASSPLIAETAALTAVAVATTAATSTSAYGFTTSAQANAIVTNLNAVIADVSTLKTALVNMGLPLT